jgi:heat-inducible transcriptional repressor
MERSGGTHAEGEVAVTRASDDAAERPLSERQAAVLRAVIASYVGDAAPVGSQMLAQLVPLPLCPASIRNTLGELAELGLVEKPHPSAGRVPTERGLRLFVDELLAPVGLASAQRRDIEFEMDEAEGEEVVPLASGLLSRHTRQLGFVLAPRLDRLVLRHVSLVRLSSEKLLAVLVTRTGSAWRCTLADDAGLSQAELDRAAALLNERVAGRTLPEVRERLAREARALRKQADRMLLRALELGARAVDAVGVEAADLVIATRLALLEQPEFRDPRRVRDLFEALETKARLLEILDHMLDREGVAVAIGEEIEEPALRGCALVARRYGAGAAPLGVLGVIGPSRMDFSRVIPLVDYVSEVVTGKLGS